MHTHCAFIWITRSYPLEYPKLEGTHKDNPSPGPGENLSTVTIVVCTVSDWYSGMITGRLSPVSEAEQYFLAEFLRNNTQKW